MSAHDDGGPAFPTGLQIGDRAKLDGGMSLRDYFAAAALTGLLANSAGTKHRHEELAMFAYMEADAMLAERAKAAT